VSGAAVIGSSFGLRCVRCGRDASGRIAQCAACGGLVDAQYPDVAAVDGSFPLDEDAIGRYRSLLPISDASSYRLTLPRTPLVELGSIGARRVFGKLEGALPTGSTKDRLAAVSLPFLLENGVRRFAFSSTGNTAIAYAHGLHAYPELEARLYLSPNVDRAKIGPVPSNLSVVVVNGDYAAASKQAREDAERTGFVPEGGFFNVGRREGAKLAYLEAVEQLASLGLVPGAVLQAVASGLGIYAAARAMEEARRAGRLTVAPKLFCAQQASCAPMALAFESELRCRPTKRIVCKPEGPAAALLLGDPFATYDYVASAVRKSKGGFVTVSEEEIYRALAEQPALPMGTSAAVGLAAAPKVTRSLSLTDDEVVLVMLTGGPGR
jgi:threonine synthase